MFTYDIIASFNELETFFIQLLFVNIVRSAYMRIRELADETHVINGNNFKRFCRNLNGEGFSEFKVILKMHIGENKKTILKSSEHSVTEFLSEHLNGNIEDNMKKSKPVLFLLKQIV